MTQIQKQLPLVTHIGSEIARTGTLTVLSPPTPGHVTQVSFLTNLDVAQLDGWKLKLPNNCTLTDTASQTALIVCNPPTESILAKFAANTPSLVMSLVAVVLSGFSLYYTLSKDSRARKQSIQDDFWLRKVISPASIEPLVKFGSDLFNELPSLITNPEEGKRFGTNRLSELKRIMAAFHSLRLIDESLHSSVLEELEKLEDRLATYMGELNEHWSSSANAPSKPEALEDMSSILVRALKPIKDHQASLGYNK